MAKEKATATAGRRSGALLLAGVAAIFIAGSCSDACAQDKQRKAAPPTRKTEVKGTPVKPGPLLTEQQFFDDAARKAWEFVDRNYFPATGLVGALVAYPNATVWDIGSSIAALYCARELRFLDAAEYDKRMRRLLQTLQTMPLVSDIAFGKFYAARNARPLGRNEQQSNQGIGWSAVDLGRLLIWLRILANNHPQYAMDVDRVIARLRFDQLVAKGYLRGGNLDRGQVETYPEGKIGYEQYAALGFAMWGARAERALDIRAHAQPVNVMGQELVIDNRGRTKLTSEPFVLMGLETGWTAEARELAWRLLAAQEERHRRTGQITIVSEDAIGRPPFYFYYYSVHGSEREFSVDAQGNDRPLDGPRWVSTKAAFAWHALLPSTYTRLAVESLADAYRPGLGWSSGLYEQTGRPTGSENINTHAVILEAALYSKLGRPLLYSSPVAPASAPARPATPEATQR